MNISEKIRLLNSRREFIEENYPTSIINIFKIFFSQYRLFKNKLKTQLYPDFSLFFSLSSPLSLSPFLSLYINLNSLFILNS